jgi:hypothetical protein
VCLSRKEQSIAVALVFPYYTFFHVSVRQSQSHIATDGQSVTKSRCRAPSGAHEQIFITVWLSRFCFGGAPSLTRGRVCLLYVPLALVPWDLHPYFYCLRFETSLFVAS